MVITGRCYCGAIALEATALPERVTYCHCRDCKRVTGGPVAAFAAFRADDVQLRPGWPASVSHATGVERWFCPDCGSPLAATYDYLPGQVYVPIGLIDQAGDLPPQSHSHANACLSWLTIEDDLPRDGASGRERLRHERP